MRRLINILSLAGIIGALILVIVLLLGIKTPQIIPTDKSAIAFVRFPLNQPQTIEFEMDEGSLARFTQREWRDQMLDWILYTVESDSGSSLENINRSLFDLPGIRYGYTKPVANFEFGKTRSAVIQDAEGKDLVVAILPACTPEERLDYLAHIADKHRKDLGEIPETLAVFEYGLGLEAKNASVTRRDNISGPELFQEKYGYLEAKVASLQDLTQFMAKIDDITFARIDGNDLAIGGRKIRSQLFRGIRVEDVAAIWQSEEKIQKALESFNAHWKTVWSDYDLKWNNKFINHSYLAGKHEANRLIDKIEIARKSLKHLYRLGLEQFVERYGADLTPRSKQLFGQYFHELADLQKQEGLDRLNRGLKEGSGFSLDPTYDHEGLRTFFANIESKLRALAILDNPLVTEQDIQEAKAALTKNDVIPYLKMLDKLNKNFNYYGKLFNLGATLDRKTKEKYQFQSARYDGYLQGTEVGMVLFYTDLLAKLWAIDYLGKGPADFIEDFKPITKLHISTVFYQELVDLSNTRLWFGTQDKGFQLADDGKKLFLARVATRVYAASSNTLTPGVEAEPAADSDAFLGWWNDHYEEVAQYEPEYQRLNEIMKWSMLISWLNDRSSGNLLGFLADVQVKKDKWFPDWARQQSDLKFTDWDKIEFYEKGYKNTKTETIPILFSISYLQAGIEWTLSGGVSLAPKQLFRERPIISEQIGKLSRRSNLNYKEAGLSPSKLGTLEGCEYKIKTQPAGGFAVGAHAKTGTKLRSRIGQLDNLEFERTVFRNPGGLGIQTKAGGRSLGDLNITGKANGFSVGWRGRDIDTGEMLARDLSRSSNPDLTLRGNPDIETFLKLPGDTHYLVKLRGSDRWLKIASDEPSGPLAKGWQSRVADPERGFRNLQLAWIDDAKMPGELGGEGYLVFEHLPPGSGPIMNLERVRGPPRSGTKPLVIESADIKITAQIDPEQGSIFLPIKELPEAIRKDPGELTKLVSEADLTQIRVISQSGSPSIHYKIAEQQIAYSDSYFHKSSRELGRDLVHNPKLFKLRFNKHLADGLKVTDAHLAQNEPVKAIHELNDLIRVHGAQPELTLRKGVAQLKLHRLNNAAKEMAMDPPRPLRDWQAFFAEFNDRIGRNKLVGIDRENLDRLADYANWQDLQARKMVPSGEVTPVIEGDRLDLVYHLPKDIKFYKVDPVTFDLILKKRITVYVQDSPGLNNIDWTISFDRSVHEAVAGNLGTASKIPRGDIGHFKPGRMYISDGKIEYKRVTPRHPRLQYRAEASPRFLRAAYIPYYPPKKDDDDDDDDNEVYVISAKGQGVDKL